MQEVYLEQKNKAYLILYNDFNKSILRDFPAHRNLEAKRALLNNTFSGFLHILEVWHIFSDELNCRE
jgi:hypothetical protein